MSKNINVEAHVNRYESTELSDVVRLHQALGEFIEKRKGDAISEMEAKLALLKSGEVPVEEPKPAPAKRRTRGGKAVTEQSSDELA